MKQRTSARIYWRPHTESTVRNRYRRMLSAWGTHHTERRISTSQGETFALVAGRPDHPSVVLIPGSMATSAMWLGTISALADRFQVIAVDIIGDAGFSSPSRPRMKSDAHARWIDDILDALQVTTASFVGASFGGWLALDYAIRRSARVSRLVLLAPAGVGRIRPRFMLKTAPLLFLGSWGHKKALAFDMGLSEQGMGVEEVAFVDLFDAVRSGFVARMQPIPVFSDKALRGLHMPTLVVVGGKDRVFDSQQTQQRIEANLSNAEVLMLPDSGHGLVNTTATICEFMLRAAPVDDSARAVQQLAAAQP